MSRLLGARCVVWSCISVAALAGSLLVTVSPVGAVLDRADAAIDYNSACGGNAVNDVGFTDVGSSHVHLAAINCLAHYEITVGTGEGEFSPNDSVTRRQMALFLQRTAGIAGVTLAGAVDQGFSDIGSESQAIQDAINQVAAAGMLTGSDGVFRPGDAVTRAEMAVAIINLLAQNGVSDFVDLRTDSSTVIRNQARTIITPDDLFADVRATQPRAVDDAVSQLFELGIAKGTSATTFSPNADVTRAQMAAFITRALVFTGARPVGVSITPGATAGTYDVSVRDESFGPVFNTRVDYFFVFGDTSGAFNADGTCDTGIVESRNNANPTTTECQIDTSDATTDGRGDVTFTIAGTPSADSPLTVWAWTGDVGDEARQGIDELATYVDTGAAVEPGSYIVKRSSPTDLARMGSTVTVTVQLVDDKDADNPNDIGRAGWEFTVDITSHRPDLSEPVTEVPNSFDPVIRKRAVSVTTDESGQATFTVGGAQDATIDPDANTDNHDVYVSWQTGSDDFEGPGVINNGASDPRWVIFSDAAPELTTVTAKSASPFDRVDDSGGDVTAYVDATLLDQYGHPISGRAVQLSDASSDLGVTPATGRAANRYTGRSGTVRLSYVRDGTAAVEGTIHAQLADENGDLVDATANPEVKSEAVTVIWAKDPEDAEAVASNNAYSILTADFVANAVVVDSDILQSVEPWVLSFDSDDQFIGVNGPTDMAGFVEAIETDLLQDMPTLKLQWEFRSATKNARVIWTLTTS